MSYDMCIGDLSETIDHESWISGFHKSLERSGATFSPGILTTKNGTLCEFALPKSDSESQVAFLHIRDFDDELCSLIFEIAENTRCYLIDIGRHKLYRAPSVQPHDVDKLDYPEVKVSNPAELYSAISDCFGEWADYLNRVKQNYETE